MLSTLTVWNFALLARTEISFGAGLNILTGDRRREIYTC